MPLSVNGWLNNCLSTLNGVVAICAPASAESVICCGLRMDAAIICVSNIVNCEDVRDCADQMDSFLTDIIESAEEWGYICGSSARCKQCLVGTENEGHICFDAFLGEIRSMLSGLPVSLEASR